MHLRMSPCLSLNVFEQHILHDFLEEVHFCKHTVVFSITTCDDNFISWLEKF